MNLYKRRGVEGNSPSISTIGFTTLIFSNAIGLGRERERGATRRDPRRVNLTTGGTEKVQRRRKPMVFSELPAMPLWALTTDELTR
jgi:hypothetical protein